MKLLHKLRSDEALMQAFQSGDASAFDVLYHRHRQPLLRFLLNMGRSSGLSAARAEELSQDVWLSIIERADSFQVQDEDGVSPRFTSFLFTVARNRWIDQYRKQRVRSHLEVEPQAVKEPREDHIESMTVAVDGGQVNNVDCQRLLSALDQLPEEQRMVFLMKEEGFSMAEIAGQLDQPQETIKSRLRYARNKLREEFELNSENLSVVGETR